jgi:pimeloyl-ACP methyl ester carboxylesterase
VSSIQGTVESAARERFIAAQQRALDRHGVEAESRFVSTGILDGPAHVLATGEGPPVMMVIGGGMVAGLWAPLMARLRNHRLYAIDPPGHGLSGTMDYRTETMRPMAVEFLSQVLDGLGLGSAPFIAQSMGGLWTSWLALDRPELVSRICYVACPAVILGTSAPLPLRLSTITPVRWLIEKLDPPSPRQVIRMGRMSGEDLSTLPEMRDLFLAYELMPGASGTLLDVHRALVGWRGPRAEVELTEDDMVRISQPVQMIWGDRDPYGSPEVGQRVADLAPRARLHVVPGGHGPWLRGSAEVAALIEEFLDGS